jgi:hypothetical protein
VGKSDADARVTVMRSGVSMPESSYFAIAEDGDRLEKAGAPLERQVIRRGEFFSVLIRVDPWPSFRPT